jgi:hypothetical protein
MAVAVVVATPLPASLPMRGRDSLLVRLASPVFAELLPSHCSRFVCLLLPARCSPVEDVHLAGGQVHGALLTAHAPTPFLCSPAMHCAHVAAVLPPHSPSPPWPARCTRPPAARWYCCTTTHPPRPLLWVPSSLCHAPAPIAAEGVSFIVDAVYLDARDDVAVTCTPRCTVLHVCVSAVGGAGVWWLQGRHQERRHLWLCCGCHLRHPSQLRVVCVSGLWSRRRGGCSV